MGKKMRLGPWGQAGFTLNPILNTGLEGQDNAAELRRISGDLSAISQGSNLERIAQTFRAH